MKRIRKLIRTVVLIIIVTGFFTGYEEMKANLSTWIANIPGKVMNSELTDKVVNSIVNNLDNIDFENIDLENVDLGNINVEELSEEELTLLKEKIADMFSNNSAKETNIIPTIEGELQVHYIDVGQGDCTLIKYGDQEILIDCAEDDNGTLIQNYLKKQGVETIDYLVLTHFDSDHIGSADVIVTKFDIENIFVTDFEKSNKTINRLNDAIKHKGYNTTITGPGNVFYLDDAEVEIIGPVKKYADSNDSSLILKLTHGENTFLFMGDAGEKPEIDLLESGYDLDIDVLKVGHHGSKYSSSKAFIDATTPEYSVISCGEDNEYGHPHAAALNNLRAAGTKLFRTDEQGSIIVVSDGTNLTWNAAPTETWLSGR